MRRSNCFWPAWWRWEQKTGMGISGLVWYETTYSVVCAAAMSNWRSMQYLIVYCLPWLIVYSLPSWSWLKNKAPVAWISKRTFRQNIPNFISRGEANSPGRLFLGWGWYLHRSLCRLNGPFDVRTCNNKDMFDGLYGFLSFRESNIILDRGGSRQSVWGIKTEKNIS